MDDQLIDYTPSSFVAIFNQSIEYSFGLIAVEGELSSFRVSKGKWVYFDIKDEEATLRCFGTVYMLPGPLEDGMLVRIICAPRLHPQFNFSLNVQSITPKGEGALAKQAELLRRKLEAEGLFEMSRKRRLPYPPESIALVTSAESAAYADLIKIISNRWPYVRIDVYDVQVQGSQAPEQLTAAMASVNGTGRQYEAVVVTRGGGSAEDLAAFNDERVVRAVASSRVPTLVAIGHEVDVSLAELAADVHASTPSNAAELLVPDKTAESLAMQSIRTQLSSVLKTAAAEALTHITHTREILYGQLVSLLKDAASELSFQRQRLALLNPREVLKRGYTLVRYNNTIVRRGKDLPPGSSIEIIFQDVSRRAKLSD